MSAQITLNGRLASDPELRFSPSGMAVAKFTIVTSRRVKNDQTQEWADADVTFWDCVAFKTLAEGIAESLTKGLEVVATGRAVQENWEDKQTGAKRSKISVKVDTIGPNLSRATAKVQKAQRDGGQQQSSNRGGQRSDDPWASNSGSGGGWGAPAGQQRGADEPPF